MEGKKAFSLYTDLIKLVNGSNIHGVEIEPMSDEEAGQLFRWILEYVNDQHPIVPKSIKYAVVQVKKALDEDLERYKRQCEINRQNGALGGRPPKKPKETENNRMGFEETEQNRTKAKKPDIDKDKDIDKDINIYNNVSFDKETMAEASKIEAQPLISLPCLKGYNHKIFEEDLKYYSELYPAVDVLQELRQMLGWLDSNPNNRKTQSGIKAFITRWLSKVQNKAKGPGNKPRIPMCPLQELGESDEHYKQRKRAWEEEYNGGFVAIKNNSIDDDIKLCKNNPDMANRILQGMEEYNPERAKKIREILKI